MNWNSIAFALSIAAVCLMGIFTILIIVLSIMASGDWWIIPLSLIEGSYYVFFGALILFSLINYETYKKAFGFIESYVGRGFFCGLVGVFGSRNGVLESANDYRWAFYGMGLALGAVGVFLIVSGVKAGETKDITREKLMDGVKASPSAQKFEQF